MRLVHRGGGQVIAVEERPFIDSTVTVPRTRQQIKRPAGVHVLNREPSLRPVRTVAAKYQSGSLTEIADDGCRFSIADHVMCGAKSVPGTAWCACHRARVYEGRA